MLAVVQPHQFSHTVEAITPGLLVVKHTAPKVPFSWKEKDAGNSENVNFCPQDKLMALSLATPWGHEGGYEKILVFFFFFFGLG